MTISSSQSYVLAAIFICVLFLQVGRVSADIDENFSYIGNKSISTHTLSRGDVDGDGDIDLIIGNFNQPNELYLNDGTGTLTLAWESADSAATIATELGDLDGDGDVDLAVANSNQKNQVFINHNGVFQLAWESPFARPTTNMAMGDLDGDGRYDLIFTNKDGGTHIYRNNSVGSFELWHSLTTEYDSFAVALADMDNDGDLDIAVGYDNIGYLNGVRTELHDRVYRNDGNGQFTVFWESPEVTSAGDIIWADMDNDDDLDLFVANVEGDINQLFRNDGTTFTKIWESAEGNNSEAVDVGDIDSDGDLDVVIGNQDNVNYWLANDGNGQLTPIWHSPDNRATRDIILADLNHDGALELLVGNGDANQLFSNLLPSSIHLAWETPVEDARWLVSADFNNDTYLDLFAGYFYSESQLWLGNGTGQFTQHWIGDDPTVYVEMAAAADVDNDVDVDLAYINTNRDSEDIRILINDGSGNFTLGWQSQPDDQLSSIAWVDFDLDGDMDLTIGRIHGNSLFRNNGDGTFEEVYQFASDEDYWTRAIAWGDFDNDGDPDVIFGNGTDTTLSPNRLYRNDGSLTFTLVWESPQTSTYDLSWGDADGDGDLDLAVANFSAYNELYQNVGTSQLELSWQSDLDDNSHSRRVFWHDVDQNGRIDLVFGNARSLQLYYNQPTTFHGPSTVSLPDSTHSYANTAGDFDNDGDIDWVAWTESALFSYQNHLYQSVRQANNPPQVFLYQPQNTPRIGQISHSAIITDTIVPITYTLADLESDPVAFVEMQYSPNGGGYWLPAVATSATITANLATTPDGILHTFEWDTFASNYFGRTDQAQLRLRVHSHGDGNAPANSFVYPNKAPSAYQHPAVVTTNSTFRLQGTQIQVFSDTIGVENQVDGAYVFRASAQDSAAQPILNTIHYAKTNEAGLLGGNDSLALDDKLTAMVLITSTGWYDLYYTSASPTEEGIEPFTVTEAGVQQLVVSAENPLILFDLHISLEWVASESYLARLNDYLQQTSEIIYDLANGQAALRNIYVHQGGEQRLASDVVIHANNDMTPHATMGGAVHQPFTATVGAVQATYLPGQVHMPAEWNRFGNETDAVGSDWAATLAHELAHYFFFLPDNYIGYEDGGLLQPTDCQGSAMTDAYHYSEFLTRSEWRDD
ncbi:MAG: FG-GAP-like repeat-containing protein, partial [Candidatus Promineifilaceae bacterium]